MLLLLEFSPTSHSSEPALPVAVALTFLQCSKSLIRARIHRLPSSSSSSWPISWIRLAYRMLLLLPHSPQSLEHSFLYFHPTPSFPLALPPRLLPIGSESLRREDVCALSDSSALCGHATRSEPVFICLRLSSLLLRCLCLVSARCPFQQRRLLLLRLHLNSLLSPLFSISSSPILIISSGSKKR